MRREAATIAFQSAGICALAVADANATKPQTVQNLKVAVA
jgi:hypothetical protein